MGILWLVLAHSILSSTLCTKSNLTLLGAESEALGLEAILGHFWIVMVPKNMHERSQLLVVLATCPLSLIAIAQGALGAFSGRFLGVSGLQ